jgi:hypothetical protein
MGTTLTGTKPKDTYDSLIKVTDNGPLSATAKYLSDGLGNDSILALSTTALGIGTASPTSLAQLNGTAGTAHLRISEAGSTIGFFGGANGIIGGATGSMAVRAEAGLILSSQGNAQTMTLTSTGNVGIGKSLPATRLHIAGADAWLTLQRTSGTTNIIDFTDSTDTRIGYVGSIASNITINAAAGNSIIFAPNNAETGRFTANGLTFNGDTAAANALDDYEEGTWTPVIRGSGTAGTYEQATTYANYTKIGRQVTLNCQINLASSITAGGTGYLQITGVPFTKAGSQEAIGSCWFLGVDFTGSFVTPRFVAAAGTSTTLYFIETIDNSSPQDMAISGIAASDIINLSITYFV